MSESQWIDVQRSERRLKSYLPPTPVVSAHPLTQDDKGFGANNELYYKCEHMRRTGSFKERGALNFLLQMSEEQRKVGVIAASAGNHAQALAYWGRKLGVPVTVVMPTIAPLTKVKNCRTLGATVVIHGATFADARDHAGVLADEKKLLYVNGFDDPKIISGAGVAGLEILDQVPDVDVIVVPVGGGGIISGIALAVKHINPRVKIIGIESENCPSVKEALKAGKPVKVPMAVTLADGLAVPEMGENAFKIIQKLVDEVVTVPEKYISIAILHLLEREKMLLEGAGAAGVAGLFSGYLDHLKGQKVVTVLCGGNIDMTALGRVIERGLYCGGRLCQFDCAISDRPGGLARFTRLLADTGVSVKEIVQERPYVSDINICSVHVTVETRDQSHLNHMVQSMSDHGYSIMKIDDGKWDHVKLSKL